MVCSTCSILRQVQRRLEMLNATAAVSQSMGCLRPTPACAAAAGLCCLLPQVPLVCGSGETQRSKRCACSWLASVILLLFCDTHRGASFSISAQWHGSRSCCMYACVRARSCCQQGHQHSTCQPVDSLPAGSCTSANGGILLCTACCALFACTGTLLFTTPYCASSPALLHCSS
jgi:hypothetical protein